MDFKGNHKETLVYIEMKMTEKIIEKIDYSENYLSKGEYDNCTFDNCIFSNSDLTNITFVECEFKNCDLSLAKLRNTALKDVKFLNCKLIS